MSELVRFHPDASVERPPRAPRRESARPGETADDTLDGEHVFAVQVEEARRQAAERQAAAAVRERAREIAEHVGAEEDAEADRRLAALTAERDALRREIEGTPVWKRWMRDLFSASGSDRGEHLAALDRRVREQAETTRDTRNVPTFAREISVLRETRNPLSADAVGPFFEVARGVGDPKLFGETRVPIRHEVRNRARARLEQIAAKANIDTVSRKWAKAGLRLLDVLDEAFPEPGKAHRERMEREREELLRTGPLELVDGEWVPVGEAEDRRVLSYLDAVDAADAAHEAYMDGIRAIKRLAKGSDAWSSKAAEVNALERAWKEAKDKMKFQVSMIGERLNEYGSFDLGRKAGRAALRARLAAERSAPVTDETEDALAAK